MNELALPSRPSLMPLLLAAWRRLCWGQYRVAIAGGVGLLIFMVVLDGESMVFHGGEKGPNWRWIAIQLVKYELWTFALLHALTWADARVDGGTRRLLAYGLAIPIGCLAGVVLSTLWFALETSLFEGGFGTIKWPALLNGAGYNLSTWLKLGGGFGLLYAEMRHSRQTRERLVRAELDRTGKARVALEARLQAMQARVEPQFLFDTLSEVKRLYAATPDRASRVLDSLITYLRAAMPRMRDTASSVAQETDLARSYLEITASAKSDLRVVVDVQKETLDWRMPPMTLLPLIDYALACCGMDGRATTVRLSTTSPRVDQLRVEVDATAANVRVSSADDRIATLRQRLQTLYGPNATLRTAQPSSSELALTLDLPGEVSAEVTAR